jgi:hypothetical protein
MSVIIKGMEMPDSCYFCRMNTECGFCAAKPVEFCGYTDDVKRPDWCPLVEIPKGASLVDRNQLLSEYDRQHKGQAGGARKIMEDAPTIFEEGDE